MNNIERIEQFLKHEMSAQDRSNFIELLEQDPQLQDELAEYEEIFEALQLEKESEFVNKQIELAREQENRTTLHIFGSMKSYISKYWQTAAVAAGVAIIASTSTFYIAKKSFLKENNQRIIQLVNRDLRKIKKNQAEIKNDLNEVKTNVVPDYPSNYTGTSFAIANNGYAMTNLHVIEGGKKVFLFTNDGKGHKCEIVYKNKLNDIAVLRVSDSNFLFSPNGLPYNLTKQADLSQKVFTLGYPKDEIVYNEGYVSSLNGKDGDTTKYQLELPSSPGVSGAPVLNEQGNIIGIINSKESLSKGITYAIKSNIVQNTIDSFDNETAFLRTSNKKSWNNSVNRTTQIKNLSNFIFVVKVYN